MTKLRGIYRIKNEVNGKSYIGCSIDIESRIKRHKRELKNGIHSNSKLQRSYNKHGDVFSYKYEELFDDITRDELIKKEVELIVSEELVEYGYNQMIDSATHFKSLNKNENLIKENVKRNSKPIVAITLSDGKLYKKFTSISEAARELNLQSTNISGVCKGRLRYLSLYTFMYEEDYCEEKKYVIREKLGKSEEHLSKMKKASQERIGRKTFKYSLNLEFLEEYPSMGDAERLNKLEKETLRRRLNSKTPFKGFYWKSSKI